MNNPISYPIYAGFERQGRNAGLGYVLPWRDVGRDGPAIAARAPGGVRSAAGGSVPWHQAHQLADVGGIDRLRCRAPKLGSREARSGLGILHSNVLGV